MARSDRSARRRLAALIAFGLAVPAVAACNALIGLDDFEKVQCAGSQCNDAGADVDSGRVDGSSDARIDVNDFDGGGTEPVTWAKWPMPNFDGEAGAIAPAIPNPHSYAISGDGRSVEDKVTNLTWEQAGDAGAGASTLKTYDEAVAYCAALEPEKWRVPKRIELVTLLDFSRGAKRFDVAFGGEGGNYWSASEKRPFSATNPEHWIVDFDKGFVTGRAKADRAFVRCVRSQ
jgi:hypothetical protein